MQTTATKPTGQATAATLDRLQRVHRVDHDDSYRFKLVLSDGINGLVATLLPSEILSYATARKALLAKYGRFYCDQEFEGRGKDDWTDTVWRLLRESGAEGGAG